MEGLGFRGMYATRSRVIQKYTYLLLVNPKPLLASRQRGLWLVPEAAMAHMDMYDKSLSSCFQYQYRST